TGWRPGRWNGSRRARWGGSWCGLLSSSATRAGGPPVDMTGEHHRDRRPRADRPGKSQQVACTSVTSVWVAVAKADRSVAAAARVVTDVSAAAASALDFREAYDVSTAWIWVANSDLASLLTVSKSLLMVLSWVCRSLSALPDFRLMSDSPLTEDLRSSTEPHTAGLSEPQATSVVLSARATTDSSAGVFTHGTLLAGRIGALTRGG